MFEQIQDWATEGDMSGFDTLAAEDLVGEFNYMDLIKGGAGMLSGAGGLMSGGKGGGGGDAAAAQQAQIQAARAQAESSARTWKIVGGIALGVIGLTGVALLMRPAAAAKAVA